MQFPGPASDLLGAKEPAFKAHSPGESEVYSSLRTASVLILEGERSGVSGPTGNEQGGEGFSSRKGGKQNWAEGACCLLVGEISVPTCVPGTRAGQPSLVWVSPGDPVG